LVLENLLFNMAVRESHYIMADLVAQLNKGSLRRLRYITIPYKQDNINIIKLLYFEGIIRLYIINGDYILVFFKYSRGCQTFKFKVFQNLVKGFIMI
jgi:hypothetical protein